MEMSGQLPTPAALSPVLFGFEVWWAS